MSSSTTIERGARAAQRLDLALRATRDSLCLIGDVVERFLEPELERLGCKGALQDTLLAVQEACSNVVRHAYRDQPPGPISIHVEVLPDLLQLSITDEGPGYDPTSVPPPDFARPQEGGFGLHLMRATMSKVAYSRRSGRNVLLMEKVLEAEAVEGAA
jgi:serine/threonine-protein kinase RsbW